MLKGGISGGPKIDEIMVSLVVEPTHLKNMLVKLDHLPKDRDENEKSLKPPPSLWLYGRMVCKHTKAMLVKKHMVKWDDQ